MKRVVVAAALGECVHVAGVSYRLTPETGERLLAEFAEAADELRLSGVRFAFGGTPPVGEAARRFAPFFDVVFDGWEGPEDVLAYLRGVRAGASEAVPPQVLVDRIAFKAPYPLLRHHFGLPTLERLAAVLQGRNT